MESLALLVAIIVLVALLSGPLALFLTWLPILNGADKNPLLKIIRRVLVTALSLVGSLFSFNLILAGSTFATFVMGSIGSLTAFFAVKREYFPDGLGLGNRNGNGFGRRGDRRNGPEGQH